jgi:DNA processing protein
MDALDSQLLLGRIPGLSAQALCRALQGIGPGCCNLDGLIALFRQPRSAWTALGLPPAIGCGQLPRQRAEIAADRRWVERERIELIHAASPLYPPQLAQIETAPALLYVRGDAQCLSSMQLAMVGSRRPSLPGRRTASEFASQLARRGLTITSGMALGIDAASHEGALAASGYTIAVLGSSLDRIYPPQHLDLAERIAAHGALISEFPRGTAPLRANFPRRNRIISGLSAGTLVVEASRCSGSLITARLAAEQGREVFAVPGPIHSPCARGCHQLIRQGAVLVESCDDILQELNINVTDHSLTRPSQDRDATLGHGEALDKAEKILLDALGFEPASVDELVERTGLTAQRVASALLNLELRGAVELYVGGRYVRL